MTHFFDTLGHGLIGPKRQRGRVVVLALGMMLALVTLAAFAGVASAGSPVTLCFYGGENGQSVQGTKAGGASFSYWAGIFKARLDGGDLKPVFCTDINNSINIGSGTNPSCYANSAIEVTNAQVACVLQHYPPAWTLGNLEAAARQAAVWHFSDGITLTGPTDVKNRYDSIVADINNKLAGGQCNFAENPSLAIEPAGAVNYLAPHPDGGFYASEHPLTVRMMRGTLPVANKTVTVTTTLGQFQNNSSTIAVQTGADGMAVITLTHNAPGAANISASAVVTLGVGTRVNPGATLQKIVFPAVENFNLSATATKNWTAGASLIVKKFHDRNRDGVYNTGDEMIDWRVRFSSDGGTSWSDWQELGADGTEVFGVEPGSYQVQECTSESQCSWTPVNPNDWSWLPTTPSLITVSVTADQGATVWFGNVALPGLRILKFRDDNGNGIQDAGEPGLNGWSFALTRYQDGEWKSSGSGLTANGGLLGFSDLPFPFNYRVTETNVPTGWYWSTPVSQELWIGQNAVYSMTFGNLQPGELQVTKEWYLNGEATTAPQQPARVCIKRTGPGTPYQTIAPTDGNGTALTADSNGFYCQDLSSGATFKNLWPGVYTVTETSPAGWTGPSSIPEQTILSGQSGELTLRNDKVAGKIIVDKITFPSGDPTAFGFTLTGPGGVNQSFSLTDAATPYESAWLTPGSGYSVSETTVPAGWTLVGAACSDGDNAYAPNAITVDPGKTVYCTFTNAQETGRLKVLKYNDLNGNHQQDPDESGLAGWTITVTNTSGLQVSEKTDADGWVSFNLPPGTYTVCETLQDGWQNTDPDDGSLCKEIEVPAGGGSSPGPTETILTIPGRGSYKIEFLGTSNNGLTWTYRVSEQPGASDLSHWTLGLCAPPSGWSPASGVDLGSDPTTGVSGIKWNLDGGFSSGEFTVTFTQTYAIGTTPVAVKDGKGDGGVSTAVGSIAGPDCSATPPAETKLGNRQLGKIIVDKVTDPAGSQISFSFELTKPGNIKQTFTLTDAQDPFDTGWVAPGTYSVAETVPAGWDLTSATCSDGQNTYQPSSIALAAGKTVTCTFNNTQQGKIIIEKVTEPAGADQAFDFTANYDLDGFSLKHGQQNQSGWLQPGTYSVSETVPDGWQLTDASCSNEDSPDAITLGAGETVTCIFTNTQQGKIIVEKVTEPAGADQAFDFTANYDLDGFSLKHGQQNQSGWLQPGTYSVSETVPDGWQLTDASCSNEDSPDAITLGAGETVTCIFTNTQQGKIIVEKFTYPESTGATFEFTTNYTDTFSLGHGDYNDSGWLVPDVYTITEEALAGWELSYAYCSPEQGEPTMRSELQPENPMQVSLEPGQTLYCAFYNMQQSRIIVDKVTVPSSDPTNFNFTLTGDDVQHTFVLSDTTAPYDSGFLSPGEYAVSEGANSSYDQVAQCTCEGEGCEQIAADEDTPGDSFLGLEETVYLGPAQTWTCTFTNTLKPGELTVTKVVNWQGAEPDPAKTFKICIKGPSFPTGTEPGACVDFGYDINGASHTWLDLIPGDYTVTEAPPGVEWSVEGSGVTVAVPAGCQSLQAAEENGDEPGFCPAVTITNTLQQGSLRVTKIVQWNGVPVDRGQDFTICITGPSYPAPNANCQTLTDQPTGGVITWTNLIPGPYIVTENDPAPVGAWTKMIAPESVTVPANGLGEATVTNSRKVPKLTLDKAIVPAPDGKVRATEGEITFTVRITNTGPTPLKVVPLTDVFTGPVEFLRSEPAHTSVSGNQISWADLVPKFGGAPLAPGSSFLISVTFKVTATTSTFDMDNTAVVEGAKDIYDTPANRAEDTEELKGGFTYVDLLYFTATRTPAGVRLDWATATEFDNAGFYILRSSTGQLADAVRLPGLIPGTGRGTHGGAVYSHVDADVQPGQVYTYWLVDVDLDGTETIHPESAAVTVSAAPKQLFLPVVSRSQ